MTTRATTETELMTTQDIADEYGDDREATDEELVRLIADELIADPGACIDTIATRARLTYATVELYLQEAEALADLRRAEDDDE